MDPIQNFNNNNTQQPDVFTQQMAPPPQWQIPAPNACPPPYYAQAESPEIKKKRAKLFGILFVPTLIYGVLYTFFLYDNFKSITMPLFVAATVAYCFYCLPRLGVTPKKTFWLYAGVMLLLGISSAITDHSVIIVFNTLGIMLLLVCMLLHNFYDDRKWGFAKYFSAIFTAVFGAIGSLGDPFSDGACYQKEHKKKGHSAFLFILIGVAIAFPLLAFILPMLSFADVVFADFLHNLLIKVNTGSAALILLMFAFAVLSAYCGMRYLEKRSISQEVKDHRRLEPLIAITILSLISLVYLLFSGIQVVYLFLGKGELPADYTYAQYAREGFFQLLFICIFNLMIVLFTLGFFRQNKALKTLLAVISFCTYIMIASSAFRMCLYIQNYNLTFLRILVLWALALLALLLGGVLAQIFLPKFPLFHYGLAVICLCYLILSFSHVDYWIASYNLSRMEAQSAENMDYNYLAHLSADAAPAIKGCKGEWVDDYVRRQSDIMDDSFRQFNISRAIAKGLFNEEMKFYHN